MQSNEYRIERTATVSEELIAFDGRLIGHSRARVLRAWTDSKATLFLYREHTGRCPLSESVGDSLTEGPSDGPPPTERPLRGYLLVLDLGHMRSMGPLVAESLEVSIALLCAASRHLLERSPQSVVVVNSRKEMENEIRPALNTLGFQLSDEFPCYATKPFQEFDTKGSYLVWFGSYAPF